MVVFLGYPRKKGGGLHPFSCKQLIWLGNQSNLRVIHFDDFGILTSIFPFDSATKGRVPTLPMSVWPFGRGVKEVPREQ